MAWAADRSEAWPRDRLPTLLWYLVVASNWSLGTRLWL
jgi:hypothetical protein